MDDDSTRSAVLAGWAVRALSWLSLPNGPPADHELPSFAVRAVAVSAIGLTSEMKTDTNNV
jgi:hypothetical protein